MIKTPKLAEIADRIAAHQSVRFADFVARPSGSRVTVRYTVLTKPVSLTKAEAWNYLQWLDAGNTGTHFDFRETEDGQ